MSDDGRATKLSKSSLGEPEIVRELYLSTFNRLPDPRELQTALRFFTTPGATRATATQDLAWALVNSAEFVFNH